MKHVTAGANPMDVKRGIDHAVEVVTEEIRKRSRPTTQHAASIAGVLMTTEALVTELPEQEESAAAGMPGSMGGLS